MELRYKDNIEEIKNEQVKRFFDYLINTYKNEGGPISLVYEKDDKRIMRLILDCGDGCTKGRAKFYGSFNYDIEKEE